MEKLTIAKDYVVVLDYIANCKKEDDGWNVRHLYQDAERIDVNVKKNIEEKLGNRLRPTSWVILSAPYGALLFAQMQYGTARAVARLASIGLSSILLPCLEFSFGRLTVVIRTDFQVPVTLMSVAEPTST